MVKILSIAGSVLLVFLSSFFLDGPQQVSILPSVPSTVVPGDTFLVKLTINKGNIRGFANLQQYLPEGFSAAPVETKNASFTFQDHLVKFTWINLPKEKSFVISYRIKTDVTCNGLKTLNGEFSYLEKDKTNKTPLTPSVLLLSNELPMANETDDSKVNMIVERSSEPSTTHYGSYDVKLKIKKGLQKNGVRIYNPIPSGYTAVAKDTHGAQFSLNNGLVEFYWETMPPDEIFDVSYRIFIDDGTQTSSPLADSPIENNPGSSKADKMIGSKTELSKSNSSKQDDAQKMAQSNPATYISIPAPQQGIYYKVQIAATRKTPDRNSDFFKTKWNIDGPVDLTMDEGWKKYLIGTFEKYSEAKQFRIETQSKVPDAFVVAFHAGDRIPLQDAWKIKHRNQ